MPASKRRPPTPDDYVVLVVEDDADLRNPACRALEGIDGVYAIGAEDAGTALKAIDRYYVDAAVVDLKLGGRPSAGMDVIDALSEASPRTRIVLWTNHLKAQTVVKYLDSDQVVRAVRKGTDLHAALVEPIEEGVRRWRDRAVTVREAAFVRRLIWNRRKRSGYQLRGTQRELGRELDRLYRRLFGEIRGLEGSGEVRVTFKPIERKGLSAAVTVEGEVTIGTDAASKPVRGNRCVVKIGPTEEIAEEAERYERFVKFGVRLAQRVELLNHAEENLLGGIAYSFAGGVFGHSVLSFDKLLQRADGRRLATAAIRALFDPGQKNWYDVSCPDVSPSDYMQESYETDFGRCFERLDGTLTTLQEKFGRRGVSFSKAGEEEPGRFSFDGGELTIPPRNVQGSSRVYPLRPACLVHGDMHGGNVMVELAADDDGEIDLDDPVALEAAELKRICLIDYRNAGPGPKAVDAVAMQASIRLADAVEIAAEVAPGVSDKKLKSEALARAVEIAANRVQAEQLWLERSWRLPCDGESVANPTSAAWVSASALLTARTRATFREMELPEYLAIAIPSAIRQFGYDVGQLGRVRLLAWLSSLYTATIP